jgi:hypothetical protein
VSNSKSAQAPMDFGSAFGIWNLFLSTCEQVNYRLVAALQGKKPQ